MNLDELIERLEIKTNILNEAKAERERYERGVKAMHDASNKESM